MSIMDIFSGFRSKRNLPNNKNRFNMREMFWLAKPIATIQNDTVLVIENNKLFSNSKHNFVPHTVFR